MLHCRFSGTAKVISSRSSVHWSTIIHSHLSVYVSVLVCTSMASSSEFFWFSCIITFLPLDNLMHLKCSVCIVDIWYSVAVASIPPNNHGTFPPSLFSHLPSPYLLPWSVLLKPTKRSVSCPIGVWGDAPTKIDSAAFWEWCVCYIYLKSFHAGMQACGNH